MLTLFTLGLAVASPTAAGLSVRLRDVDRGLPGSAIRCTPGPGSTAP